MPRFSYISCSSTQSFAILTSLAVVAAPVFAQSYLPPETPARRELVTDNPYAGGQPSDLTFKVESVKFLGPPCSTGEKDILQQAEIVIEVGWIKSISYFGQLCIQAEGSDSTNGNDQIVFEINGRDHWTVASVTRDGVDVMGGVAPEGQNGGNGTWDGVKLTPPGSFETGKYQSGSDPKQTMRYTITLDYHPQPGDLCTVVGFLLRGYYLHTYDGSFEFGCDNAIDVAASFPWGVSLGGTVTWTNDHAWQKQLINPAGPGPGHTASYEPGGGWVPADPCCPVPPPVITPEPGIDDADVDPDTDGDGVANDFTQTTTFHFENGADITSAAVELIGRTPLGVEVIRADGSIALPCRGDCTLAIPFTLPIDYPYDVIVMETLVYGDQGGVASTQELVPVPPLPFGARVPVLAAASGMPDGRLLVPDVLMVQLFDPARPLPQWAQFTEIKVFDQFGQVRDVEQGIFSGNPQWQIQMQVKSAAQFPAMPMNGQLSVRTGDTIAVRYLAQQGALLASVEVNDRIDAIVDAAASADSFTALRIEGSSTGVPTILEVTFDDGASTMINVVLPPGTPGDVATGAMHTALTDAGVALAVDEAGALWTTGPASLVKLRFSTSDPGFDVLGASAPAPDLNGDGAVNASDLAILLGAWGTPAGDLNGDGITSGADLAVLLGAWS